MPKGLSVLTLDLATRTGWAYKDTTGHVESGVQDFSLKRGESPGLRCLYFGKWLSDLVKMMPVDLIVFEMPHLRGGATATFLAGLQTRVEEIAAINDIEYSKAHSASIKKVVLGTGRGDKSQMVAWAQKRLGRPPIDDNEADALGILAWAEATLGV